MKRSMIGAGAVALLAACAWNPPPVPLVGVETDVVKLAGEWYGNYWSAESGRSGSILFRLTAGADTAVGDVLMVPRDQPEAAGMPPAAATIPIRFVGIEGSRVRGVLAQYRDPVCGCRLETVFSGQLRADTISGTYESRHLEGGSIQTGEWQVVRQRVR